MLGYVIFQSKYDVHIKEREGEYIFKHKRIYVAKIEHSNCKIYDERDNAYELGYSHSCLRMIPHYSNYFRLLGTDQISNSKEFYKLRLLIREYYNNRFSIRR